MARFTPSLNAKGIYTLRMPFPDIGTKVYRCVAIRSFQDYVDLGESLFDTVYGPYGLSEADLQADLEAGAHIVTLASTHEASILVPDTYIAKYPDLEYVEYSNIVLSASLGALPNDLSLGLLQEQIAGVISDVIGATPVVRIHTSSSSGVVSMAQHQINEAGRQASITNRLSDRAQRIQLQTEKAALEQRVRDLEELIENME